MSKSQPLGCLFGFLANLFGRSGEGSAPAGSGLPLVIVNKRFVTEAEANFFRVLKAVVGQRGHVLAQVSLRQLLWFPPNQKDRSGLQGWRNKVGQKSVDFVVCDAGTLRPHRSRLIARQHALVTATEVKPAPADLLLPRRLNRV